MSFFDFEFRMMMRKRKKRIKTGTEKENAEWPETEKGAKKRKDRGIVCVNKEKETPRPRRDQGFLAPSHVQPLLYRVGQEEDQDLGTEAVGIVPEKGEFY